ncbi:SpoIIAA family protein [Actinomycetospora lemnae]|uniref:STAS/SEC14 domain-containing protein n=1 Tax=Actinomycetospora lemnae TaxID=3019891 RepID=A0ABT5SZU4_9PSEU|nr:STAS/SEC14 domain-containing protein [Actinomycetospora sp. DW7H6]MDD7967955.1 STAS/SEC14 domain-containing protein [Actinomycetospora sp. DW7H6]
MLEKMTDVPPEIVAVRAAGVLTRGEYDRVVLPMLQETERTDRRMRILCQVEDDYTGLTPPALWEDLRLGVRAIGRFAACAVVTDVSWIRTACRLAAFAVPYPLRVFGIAEREDAVAWLLSLPEAPRIRTRTGPGTGVVVVEADRPLQAADIDALAAVVDEQLGTTPELRGLVLHAPGVPGWENVAALWRHLGFVAGHQRRIRRLALAVDGTVPTVGATIADRALHPVVRHFPSADLDAAIAWAAEEDARRDGEVPAGAAG